REPVPVLLPRDGRLSHPRRHDRPADPEPRLGALRPRVALVAADEPRAVDPPGSRLGHLFRALARLRRGVHPAEPLGAGPREPDVIPAITRLPGRASRAAGPRTREAPPAAGPRRGRAPAPRERGRPGAPALAPAQRARGAARCPARTRSRAIPARRPARREPTPSPRRAGAG